MPDYPQRPASDPGQPRLPGSRRCGSLAQTSAGPIPTGPEASAGGGTIIFERSLSQTNRYPVSAIDMVKPQRRRIGRRTIWNQPPRSDDCANNNVIERGNCGKEKVSKVPRRCPYHLLPLLPAHGVVLRFQSKDDEHCLKPNVMTFGRTGSPGGYSHEMRALSQRHQGNPPQRIGGHDLPCAVLASPALLIPAVLRPRIIM